MISRRSLLIAGAAVAVSGLAGGTLALASQDRLFAEAVLRTLSRLLPRVALDASGVRRFAAEVRHAGDGAYRSRWSLYRASVLAVAGNDAFLPARLKAEKQAFERYLLTRFLVGSNFFYESASGNKLVTYDGPVKACRNPFARFELA